ncbi:hypothetical protein [Aquimarina spongiae]|uniref:DUF8213 domain-containing protein n=1 Tax=Aquimarina spongiae TaxID=570521 RepID=A0A1M6CDC1_9FLAO|nr:hypothetical protein [Aquimarina spongiae]SHI58997.1 hypothetical protein SAMN04488508_10262 [Aquimarina spongiae]
MKNRFRLLGIALICLLLTASCEQSEENQTAQSVGLEIQGTDVLSGHKRMNGHEIRFKVIAKSDVLYVATINIDQHALTAVIDYATENIDLDGSKAVLSKSQKEAFLDLGQELSEYLFKDGSVDDFTLAEFTLLRLLEYWAKSPNHYAYDKLSIKSNRLSGIKGSNEGITCIRKNTYVTAVYDDARGREFRERKLVNGDRCLGRCGSGCPGIFTLASAWTKDCLDHDQCGRVLGGSTNPFDSNCGDEYGQAADDYLFGVIRGCRG